MGIRDYLDQRREELAEAQRRIRDFAVFDFSFIPDEPLMRDEAKPIADGCLRYLHTGIPNHLFIFGPRGCGKTLMVRHIAALLEQEEGAHVLYANCRQHNTSFKLLAHLLGERPRGHSLDELWQRFAVAFPSPVILILDEVDLLSDRDRRKDLLYLLSRSSRPGMVILLSNHPRFLDVLDPSIRSSLQAELIHFRHYDAEQIHEILRARATQGLYEPPWPSLSKIAALSTKSAHADVRVAIKTLYYLAMEPDAEVDDLFQRARRDLVADVLADLSERLLLMLQAAAAEPEPFVKPVYRHYRRLSRAAGDEPFSYVYFYTNLSYLQSLGLILLVSTKVRRVYTNQIQLLFDPELLEALGWRAGAPS